MPTFVSLLRPILFGLTILAPLISAYGANTTGSTPARPNILYIMSDDHAAHAVSAYGSKVNKTPHIDRIAKSGMVLENCFVTNALCAPSRATILTGKYSHKNGVRTHRSPPFDGTQLMYPKLLQDAGYETAVVGKWHLKSDPTGFDYWNVLPGQGAYHNPRFIEMGTTKTVQGYATDIITDVSIQFLENRDKSKPFLLISQHKAPHRDWSPDEKHLDMFDEDIPLPETFHDDYTSRTYAARVAKMRILDDMTSNDTKGLPPPGLTKEERKYWNYQQYMKHYLACVASIDDNVGRLLDYLEKEDLLENTIVIYTSDQGFFLGDHGWYDKRFMYEESLQMPFLVQYPGKIKPGSTSDAMVINADFAPTLLELAGVEVPAEMQGESFREVLMGDTPENWRKSMYYHFFEYPDNDHMVPRHYGVRTERYKLIHFYHPRESWELFDLQTDPNEMHNIYDLPENAELVAELKSELERLREKYEDTEDGTTLKR